MMMNETESEVSPYAAAMIKLLQGVIYIDDDNWWKIVIGNQLPIASYFSQLGLELIVNEQEGFAFLRQPPKDKENPDSTLPRLMRIRSMTYEQTLLCVMLREWIEEFDVRTSEGRNLYVTQQDIRERIENYFQDSTNRSRLQKQLDKTIEQAVSSLGLLRPTGKEELSQDDTQYEVMRIVKAMIDNNKLEEIRNRLKDHAESNRSNGN
jgi:uncharacterized protein (DUF2267 family)